MSEAMANGVAAKKKFVNHFAQLDGYREQVRCAHRAVGGAIAPAIDVRREEHRSPADFHLFYDSYVIMSFQ